MATSTEDDGDLLEEDFYTFLNLPRNVCPLNNNQELEFEFFNFFNFFCPFFKIGLKVDVVYVFRFTLHNFEFTPNPVMFKISYCFFSFNSILTNYLSLEPEIYNWWPIADIALQNLQAPQEDITNAYRRLSRIYHPDKHTDPLRKKEAEVLFNKTKKAYEVLSDPHKRAIYDSLGTKGLETEGWEVVQRTKTPQEIREEYERIAQINEERRLHQRTNPNSNFRVAIDATELFSPYEDEYEEYGWVPVK